MNNLEPVKKCDDCIVAFAGETYFYQIEGRFMVESELKDYDLKKFGGYKFEFCPTCGTKNNLPKEMYE